MEKIIGEGQKFERIRRVTGYLAGDAERISLRQAVANELVSIKDWRKKAWKRVKDGDTEIWRYENHETVES